MYSKSNYLILEEKTSPSKNWLAEEIKTNSCQVMNVISIGSGIKRNDIKTSSLTRHYHNKPKDTKSSTMRYSIQSNRSSREYKIDDKKHDLILIGVNKNPLTNQRQGSHWNAKSSTMPPSPIKEDTQLYFQTSSKLDLNFLSRNDRNGSIGIKSKTKIDYKFSKILNDIGPQKQTNK